MKITIVGGGFGGVKTALELAKHKHNRVTLISNKEDFQYFPALYGTATGRSHKQAWIPLGEIFASMYNVEVIIDAIKKVDPVTKTLLGASGNTYEYHSLVLALGTVTTYFGIKGLDHYAYGIKSENEINALKHHLYKQLGEEQALDTQYVIIGGGPTGVELAAALGTYIQHLCKHYKLRNRKIPITIVEAAPRLLARMSETTSRRVKEKLEELGVKVELNKKVESANADGLIVNGKPLKTHTIIWTSGVANNPFFENNKEHFEFSPNGRIIVNEYMRTKSGIYVIGDNAFTPYSGLAQTALHDALFVSDNFKRRQANRPLKKYKAVMPPVVVPIGDKWAAFEWRFLKLYGWPAAPLRKAADIIGYRDILPLGTALGKWSSQTIIEENYFTPSAPRAISKANK